MESYTEKKFISCPLCSGSGKNKLGFRCPNCAGMGIGIFEYTRFFYWGPKFGIATIELDHLRKKIQKTILLFAYFIGFLGLLALAIWFYKTSQDSFGTFDYFFWKENHYLLFVFWVSAIADMYIIYRAGEGVRLKKEIGQISYDDKYSIKELPNNWEQLKKYKNKSKIDVEKGFSEAAYAIAENAFLLAHKMGHAQVLPIHIFFSLLGNQEVQSILSRLNADTDRLLLKVKEGLASIEKADGQIDLSLSSKEILIEAYLEALVHGQSVVSPKNLIVSCVKKDKYLGELLYDMEITPDKILNVVVWFNVNDIITKNYKAYRKKSRLKPSTNMDRAYTAVATPVLDNYGYDLTVASKWGKLEYCVSREDELNKIFQIFEGGMNGALLVGPKGVGKNTILSGLAELMVKEDVPLFMRDKRLVEIDAARLVSGATPSQAEGRMMVLVDETMRAGNVILCLNNIENIIGITSGGEGSMDLSEVLASAIDKRQIYCIATATAANYTKYIEDKSIGKIMRKVDVLEPVGDRAIQMVESKIGLLEGSYGVYYSYNAIEQAIKLSKKYIHDKYLPEKAINILKLVGVNVRKTRGMRSVVTKEDISRAIAEITKIPTTKITDTEGKALLELEKNIHKRMIGQEEAVNMVSASLRRARAQLREGKKPIANFLFLGPTGVGKTELAKTVSEIYFGDEKYMIRVDMSEYQHPDSIKKMIGDATGIKGYLTEAVRKSPFSLILLDELEKAHGDILNLFLQVMDDGRLTDGQGRTVDFTNSIIIATSNVGALYIQESIFGGKPHEEIKRTLINEHLNKVMRPELINRFDGVIVFEPLSREHVFQIAGLLIDNIAKILEVKGIALRAEDEGVRILAKDGYDPKFGARPLRRVLQERVENIVANKILSGELERRDTVVINKDAEIEVEKGREL